MGTMLGPKRYRVKISCSDPGGKRYAGEMERNETGESLSFGARLSLGLRVIFNGGLAARAARGLAATEERPAAAAPERTHASGLVLLSALHREGRLLDFAQQDVAGFSDVDVGAAARVVHAGCRKVLQQFFEFEPAAREAEGATVTVPAGFDARRWRLTGNVAGQAPFRGTLRHHGWVARQVRMPAISDSLDPRVIAPAEVELP